MTQNKDHDPGKWYRTLSPRAVTTLAAVCVAIVIGVFIYLAVTGTPLF